MWNQAAIGHFFLVLSGKFQQFWLSVSLEIALRRS
ncbi:hypothetical protein SLEP1_g32452 [Rubroshorea leprosula]|uniref:Uncharacterized protein n=1 Tax=Rubroshorea leprosula TaxID=152421 RepID=A0AAV5KDI3_9ROSI|nr:hypothetical protein SLEP1_g32452 [Rubroshorea leprosula]